MSIATSLGISLILQDGVRDTVVMIPAERGVMETLAVTGQFAVSIIVLILLAALVYMLLAMRKTVQELTKLLIHHTETFRRRHTPFGMSPKMCAGSRKT
jgi:hypothetical protein